MSVYRCVIFHIRSTSTTSTYTAGVNSWQQFPFSFVYWVSTEEQQIVMVFFVYLGYKVQVERNEMAQ